MKSIKKAALLVLASGLLAACGGNTSSATPAASSEPAASVSSAASSEKSAEASSAKEESSPSEASSVESKESSAAEGTSVEEQSSAAEESSSVEEASSAPTVTTYAIRVETAPGITISVDKEFASRGELVTITVAVESGYELISLTANTTKLNVENNVAQFTMPNRSVTIRATLSVSGEVTLQGDFSAVLAETEEGSGLFVARNVRVDVDSRFTFCLNGTDLSSLDLDPSRCFAALDHVFSSKVNGHSMALKVAGGASYDFYFDSNANPASGRCYVVKVAQNTLPTDEASLCNIFDGAIRDYTLNPVGLTTVSYKDKVNDVDFEYSNAEESSLAIVKTYDGSSAKGVKYVHLDKENGVQTFVDTYVESPEREKTYHKPNLNTSARSGRYGIVANEDLIEFSHFQKSEYDALLEKNVPNKNLEAIRYELYDGFASGFSTDPNIGTDGLGDFDISITSAREEGGFSVTLASYREIDTTTVASSSSYEKNFYKYDAVLHFNEAGAPLYGSYLAKTYNDTEYNWDTNALVKPEGGVEIHNIEFEFGYEEQLEPVFDASNYLSSSITASVRDEALGADYAEKNAIMLRSATSSTGAVMNYATLASGNLPMDDDGNFYDRGNYTIISSSDAEVIGLTPWGYLPLKAGKTTLTFGNPAVESAPRVEVEVEVVFNAYIRSFYLFTADDSHYSLSDEEGDSTNMLITAGRVHAWAVIAVGSDENGSSSGIGELPYPFTATLSGKTAAAKAHEGEIALSYGRSTKDRNNTLIVDTTGMSAFDEDYLQFDVSIECDHYLPGRHTDFVLTVFRNTNFNPLGAWEYASNPNVYAVVKKYVAGDEDSLSYVHYGNKDYYFACVIDEYGDYGLHWSSEYIADPAKRTTGCIEIVELVPDQNSETVMGIYLEANDGTWSGNDEYVGNTVLLGYKEEDEGFVIDMEYAAFYPSIM